MTAGPTRNSVVAAQVAHELSELAQLSISLAAVVSPGAGLDRGVLDRFELLIDGLRAKLAPIPRIADRDGAAAAWSELTKLRPSTAEIKREALAFVQGVLVREKGIDNGIGLIGERLLAELSERTGADHKVLLALSENEFFQHTVSMVRGRFPDVSAWNLPILAHEFGHHVAATLRHADPVLREDYRPIAVLLSQEADDEAARSGVDRAQALAHLHELFADVYATYLLGAAYPLNMITLSARPDGFGGSTRTHPSWSRRIHTMRAAVKVLGQAEDAAGYRELARTITANWHTIAGDDITETEQAIADAQAGAMIHELAHHAFARARYPMPERVSLIVIDPDRPPAQLPDDVTLVDVLNAAWRWRGENWAARDWVIERASLRALEFCRQLLGCAR